MDNLYTKKHLTLVHSRLLPKKISHAARPVLTLIKGGVSENFNKYFRVGPNNAIYCPNPQDPVYRR